MEMTSRELWTGLHGIVLGSAYLMAFTGGLVALWDLRSDRLGDLAVRRAAGRLMLWMWAMAVLAWLTVLIGTYVIYPWYRAKPATGTAGIALMRYPKFFLLGSPQTADWHEFGMEWKEHIAWLAPILATTVAVLVTKFHRRIAADRLVRNTIVTLYAVAFFAASAAGLLGALIDKAAPVR